MAKKLSLLNFDDMIPKREEEIINNTNENKEVLPEPIVNTASLEENKPKSVSNSPIPLKTIDNKTAPKETPISVSSSSIAALLSKHNKLTVEDTCTRQTFFIKNDLLERFNALAATKKRGFKTDVINIALKKFLDEIEGK